MSKAILVMEMPDKCGNCPLLQQWYDDEYEKWSEMCFYRYCEIEDTESKLNICPLKPLPKQAICYPVNQEPYRDGWNDCIDEILGEEEKVGVFNE